MTDDLLDAPNAPDDAEPELTGDPEPAQAGNVDEETPSGVEPA